MRYFGKTKIAPEAIRTFDFAQLDRYVSEICKDKEVLYAVCYDKDGKALTLGEVLGPSEDILELERKCIDEAYPRLEKVVEKKVFVSSEIDKNAKPTIDFKDKTKFD